MQKIKEDKVIDIFNKSLSTIEKINFNIFNFPKISINLKNFLKIRDSFFMLNTDLLSLYATLAQQEGNPFSELENFDYKLFKNVQVCWKSDAFPLTGDINGYRVFANDLNPKCFSNQFFFNKEFSQNIEVSSALKSFKFNDITYFVYIYNVQNKPQEKFLYVTTTQWNERNLENIKNEMLYMSKYNIYFKENMKQSINGIIHNISRGNRKKVYINKTFTPDLYYGNAFFLYENKDNEEKKINKALSASLQITVDLGEFLDAYYNAIKKENIEGNENIRQTRIEKISKYYIHFIKSFLTYITFTNYDRYKSFIREVHKLTEIHPSYFVSDFKSIFKNLNTCFVTKKNTFELKYPKKDRNILKKSFSYLLNEFIKIYRNIIDKSNIFNLFKDFNKVYECKKKIIAVRKYVYILNDFTETLYTSLYLAQPPKFDEKILDNYDLLLENLKSIHDIYSKIKLQYRYNINTSAIQETLASIFNFISAICNDSYLHFFLPFNMDNTFSDFQSNLIDEIYKSIIDIYKKQGRVWDIIVQDKNLLDKYKAIKEQIDKPDEEEKMDVDANI